MKARRQSRLLYCALLAAFSPVINDLIQLLRAEPDQRTILFPLLLIVLLSQQRADLRRQERHLLTGLAMLSVGLTALIVGIASGTWLIARLGFPVALVGMGAVAGGPSALVSLLALGIVPIPDFVKHATSPGLESLLGGVAAAVFGFIGVPIETGGPLLEYGSERLELMPADTGIVTMVLLAEFGWYRAIREQQVAWNAAVSAIRWALLSAVVQPLLILVCVAALPLQHPEFGRFGLNYGVVIALASTVIFERLRRSRPPPPPRGADIAAT